MTDKRTKADLLAEIERLTEDRKNMADQIMRHVLDINEAEDKANHYRAEAARLSKYADALLTRIDATNDRLGETLEAAKDAIRGTTQIYNTRLPDPTLTDMDPDWRLDPNYRHKKDVKKYKEYRELPF